MIVMKFGGTSVGSPERIEQVFQIVSPFVERKPVVVVSAVGGVTDLLLEAGQNALNGKVDISAVKQKHQTVIEGLGLDPGIIDAMHTELQSLLMGVMMIREISPRTSDYLVSFGERVSCQLVAAHFRNRGINAQHHFAYDLGMHTDEHFQQAAPLPSAYDTLKKNILALDHLPIVTGFIGHNQKGEITTLGRGGSDYTAAILGAAIGAEEIQIWTDVDGILSTDPRIVKVAHNLPVVSFKEAAELAYFGAKVLHPKTIRPAMDRDIPVVVKNTANPEHPGTRILADSPKSSKTVKAISVKKNVWLINIYSLRMLDAFGFMAKIFDIFSKHQVVVDMVSTSEVSVTVTVDAGQQIDPVVQELSAFAQVRVDKNLSIICLVGEGMKEGVGVAGSIFAAMAQESIPVEMISQGASDINLGFVVGQEHASKAVACLHKVLFEEER